MNKIYLITYSPTPPFNQAAFLEHIQALYARGVISDWWHYIDSTYLVSSNRSVNELYNEIFPGVPQRYLLIVEVTKNGAQGWLPPAAWEWIQKYFGPPIN